ncbi:MAG: DUF58 domain-containing protein, partial [Opitutaceae bacterium]|nr:DUF58 domain-containing protein [Verrucomicrobiales bacterium]
MLLTVGLVLQLGLLVYAMYVLIALLLLTRYLAQTWIENIVVTRVGDRATAEIGDEFEVRVTVHNQGRWRVPWLIVEESLPRAAMTQNPRLRVKGRTLQLWQLPAGSAKQLSYRVRIDMRGLYQLGPLLIESGDLFGLHRRYRIATEPHFVLVLPRTIEMADYDLASRRPMGEVRISHRLFEDPTRINGVRPYQIGD